MEKVDILNRAINVLRNSLNLSQNILVETEPFTEFNKKTASETRLQLKITKNSEGKYTEGSIENKLTGKSFITEVRKTVEPRFLKSGISHLKQIKSKYPDLNPLIISPYFGPGGRALCRDEGVNYIDTFGNVGIFLKDVYILKESQESPKRDRKELKFLFSPKSTRLIRIILENPERRWRLNELAAAANISLGGTYNVIKKLADELYIEQTQKGVYLTNPAGLLEKWCSVYKITKVNKIVSFYLSESIYKALIKRLADIAEKGSYSYAFTLFAGANFIIPYVHTPHVHIYLIGDIEKFVEEAKLKAVDSGGNVHIVTPYDEGILNPIQVFEGVKIVGNVQLYLDLLNYPARGEEQARVLREKYFSF